MTSMRRVLLLELEDQADFNKIYLPFLQDLGRKCDLVRAKTVDEAFEYLVQDSRNPLSAILVWEPTIMASCYTAEHCQKYEVTSVRFAELKVLANAMVQFTKKGGTTVFGGLHGSFMKRDEFDHFFPKIWNMPWQLGQYRRIIRVLNMKARVQLGGASSSPILKSYSMKAPSLKNVAREDLAYLDEDVFDEETTGSNNSVANVDSGAAVFAQYGRGRLGYLGDVNNEIGSQKLLLAMLDV